MYSQNLSLTIKIMGMWWSKEDDEPFPTQEVVGANRVELDIEDLEKFMYGNVKPRVKDITDDALKDSED